MTFIGIISDCKRFEKIKEIIENQKGIKINLIHINKKSIGNIKNIKFEMIIIDDNLKEFENEKSIIEQMEKQSKYIAINTDFNIEYNINVPENIQIITYGLNQQATVTISSITETDLLLYLQRNIKNKAGKIIEIGEKRVELTENNKLKTYEILIIFIVFLVY